MGPCSDSTEHTVQSVSGGDGKMACTWDCVTNQGQVSVAQGSEPGRSCWTPGEGLVAVRTDRHSEPRGETCQQAGRGCLISPHSHAFPHLPQDLTQGPSSKQQPHI